MKNIEFFDRCVGLILGRLYENFSVPLDFDLLMDIPENLFNESDESLVVARKMGVYEHTFRWLVSAGFVWAENISELKAGNVRLTLKGLEVLKKPTSLEPNKSIGEKLTEVLKDISKTASKVAVVCLVKEAFTFAPEMFRSSSCDS